MAARKRRTANQIFAELILAGDPKAIRVANLVAEGRTVAFALKVVKLSTKEFSR